MSENTTPEGQSTEPPQKLISFLVDPPMWFWLAVCPFPLWWPYYYILLLSSVNKITVYFGSQLYLLLPAKYLFSLWEIGNVAGWLLMAVLLFSRLESTRKKGFYTLLIWLTIILFWDVTQGAMTAAFEVAAGRPRASFSNSVQTPGLRQ